MIFLKKQLVRDAVIQDGLCKYQVLIKLSINFRMTPNYSSKISTANE